MVDDAALTDENSAVVQLDRWPLLIVYSPASMDEEALVRQLKLLGDVYDERKEPYVLILDARSGRRPKARERAIQTEFRERYEDHIKAYRKGMAIVTNSELIKGVATAMFWLKKPDVATKFFTDFDEATEWAEQQLAN